MQIGTSTAKLDCLRKSTFSRCTPSGYVRFTQRLAMAVAVPTPTPPSLPPADPPALCHPAQHTSQSRATTAVADHGPPPGDAQSPSSCRLSRRQWAWLRTRGQQRMQQHGEAVLRPGSSLCEKRKSQDAVFAKHESAVGHIHCNPIDPNKKYL